MGYSTFAIALETIHDTLVNLGLPGIPPDHIQIISVDHERTGFVGAEQKDFPGVLLLPQAERRTMDTNASDTVIHPTMVMLYDSDFKPDSHDMQQGGLPLDIKLLWRQLVLAKFSAVVIDDMYYTSQPATLFDASRWLGYGQWSSTILIEALAREVVR